MKSKQTTNKISWFFPYGIDNFRICIAKINTDTECVFPEGHAIRAISFNFMQALEWMPCN